VRAASGIPRDAAFTNPRKAVPRLPYGFACHRNPKDLGIYYFCDFLWILWFHQVKLSPSFVPKSMNRGCAPFVPLSPPGCPLQPTIPQFHHFNIPSIYVRLGLHVM
jgi:hypothetical protein